MVVEVEDHENMGKVERYVKTRLSSDMLSVSNTIFKHPPVKLPM